MNLLTTAEHTALEEHEQVIARGLGTFVEVGRALQAIRDGRLYRAHHGTFEAYCQERWRIGRAHAYRLMESAQVIDALSPVGDTTGLSERQARELAPMRHDPDAMSAALARARTLAGRCR